MGNGKWAGSRSPPYDGPGRQNLVHLKVTMINVAVASICLLLLDLHCGNPLVDQLFKHEQWNSAVLQNDCVEVL